MRRGRVDGLIAHLHLPGVGDVEGAEHGPGLVDGFLVLARGKAAAVFVLPSVGATSGSVRWASWLPASGLRHYWE